MNRSAPALDGYESGEDAHLRATATALREAATARTVVLVEGISDQIAVDATFASCGRDLGEEQVVVVPIGGAQAISDYVARFVDASVGHRDPVDIVGLCDAAEATFFASAFEAHGLGDTFAVCRPDLEAELICAFEPDELESIIKAQGELRSLRTMQKQAAWRGRAFDEQVHRWMRAKAVRSSRYASILVYEAGVERLPAPLRRLTELVLPPAAAR